MVNCMKCCSRPLISNKLLFNHFLKNLVLTPCQPKSWRIKSGCHWQLYQMSIIFMTSTSGFRQLHSKETALLRVSNDISMHGDAVECSVLVLSAASETVDHSILIDREVLVSGHLGQPCSGFPPTSLTGVLSCCCNYASSSETLYFRCAPEFCPWSFSVCLICLSLERW